VRSSTGKGEWRVIAKMNDRNSQYWGYRVTTIAVTLNEGELDWTPEIESRAVRLTALLEALPNAITVKEVI